MDRFPDRPRDTLDGGEREAFDRIAARRGKVPAPFVPLLKSPEVADLFEQFSARLWTSLPADLLEAVFLMVARRCRCAYQWHTHVPKGLAAGLSADDIARLSRGEALADGLRGDVTRFVLALHTEAVVPQATYEAVVRQLSERGTVELVAFCGAAHTVALLLNVRQPALPAGAPVPF
jgi:alkylhydroperoxidase family enzyme